MVRRRYGAGVDIALISCYMQKIASAALFPIPGLARQKEDENSDRDTDRWVCRPPPLQYPHKQRPVTYRYGLR